MSIEKPIAGVPPPAPPPVFHGRPGDNLRVRSEVPGVLP
jgi:hypothetical protein